MNKTYDEIKAELNYPKPKLLILCPAINIKNSQAEFQEYHVVATEENENQFNIIKNTIDGTFPTLSRDELDKMINKHNLTIEHKDK